MCDGPDSREQGSHLDLGKVVAGPVPRQIWGEAPDHLLGQAESPPVATLFMAAILPSDSFATFR